MNRKPSPKVLTEVLTNYIKRGSRISPVDLSNLVKRVVVSVFGNFRLTKETFARHVLGQIVKSALGKYSVSVAVEKELFEALKNEWSSSSTSVFKITAGTEGLSVPVMDVYRKYITPFIRFEVGKYVLSQRTPQDEAQLIKATNIVNAEIKNAVRSLARFVGTNNDFVDKYTPENTLLRDTYVEEVAGFIIAERLKTSSINKYASINDILKFFKSNNFSGISVEGINKFVVDVITEMEGIEQKLINIGIDKDSIGKIIRIVDNKDKQLETAYNLLLPLYDKATPEQRTKYKEMISNLTLNQWLIALASIGIVGAVGTALYKLRMSAEDKAIKSTYDLLNASESTDVEPPPNQTKDRKMYETDPDAEPDDFEDTFEPEPESTAEPESATEPESTTETPVKTPFISNKDESVARLMSLLNPTTQVETRAQVQPLSYPIPSVAEFVPKRRMRIFEQSISKGVRTGLFKR